MLRKILAILLLLVTAMVFGQDGTDITIGKIIKIKSTILGEERTIYVSTPATYNRSNKSYPVMYVLDGSPLKIHFYSGMVRGLAAQGQSPEMIIVAIANTNRFRDMTPTKVQRIG